MLVLFDIDGTLLGGAAPAHREALHAALLTVHGVDVSAERVPLQPAGRTDGEIARILLLQAGVPARAIDERARDVQIECSRVYAERCPPSLTDRVLPGIPELLEGLQQRGDVRLSLVTGNYQAVARLKLRRAGLGRFFGAGQGAFGSDSEDRAALPPLARRRAGRAAGAAGPYPRERTILIGDTPRDVACARADGIRCLAVATGPFEVAELGEADGVARDALELRGVLEALLTPGG